MSCPFSGAVKSPKSGGCPFGFSSGKSGDAEEAEEGFGCCRVIKTGGLDLTAIIEGQDNVVEMKNVPGFLAIEDLVQLLLTSSSVTAIQKNTPPNDVTITKLGNDYPFPQNAKLSSLDLHTCDKIILRPLQKPDKAINIRVASAPTAEVVELNGLPSLTPLSRLVDILIASNSLSSPSPAPSAVQLHTSSGVLLADQSLTLRSAGILDGDWLLASHSSDSSSLTTLPRIKKLDVTKMDVPTATPRDLKPEPTDVRQSRDGDVTPSQSRDSDVTPPQPIPESSSDDSDPGSASNPPGRALRSDAPTRRGAPPNNHHPIRSYTTTTTTTAKRVPLDQSNPTLPSSQVRNHTTTTTTTSRCPYTRACALASVYVLPYKAHMAVVLLAFLWAWSSSSSLQSIRRSL